MTNVEDSIIWHEPYLYARRIGTDGPDKEKFKAMGEKFMAAQGVNREELFAFAKSLPFGYVGTEGNYIFKYNMQLGKMGHWSGSQLLRFDIR